ARMYCRKPARNRRLFFVELAIPNGRGACCTPLPVPPPQEPALGARLRAPGWGRERCGTALPKSNRSLAYALPRSVYVLLLHFTRRRLGLEAPALARGRLTPGLFPLPAHRARGPRLPALGPVAERIAMPRLLDRDRRQPKLRPQCLRALHELLLGQSERRHRPLHGGVDQELRAK